MLGLRKLGFRSIWVDRHDPAPDPLHARRDVTYLARRFAWVAREFGFEGDYCVLDPDGNPLFGMDRQSLENVCRDAELLIGVSETLSDDSPLSTIPRRARLDVDPGFTQIWAQEWDMGFSAYNLFFTTGQTVGKPEFGVEGDPTPWVPTLPPVDLDWWKAESNPEIEPFTTVADWRGSQVAKYRGEIYDGKRSQFLKLLALPKQTSQYLELALCIEGDYDDANLLEAAGWNVIDSYRVAGDVFAYRDYIRYSRAEFSVAKHGYVKSNSGWFSDRTAAYLAAGKPALVQSTGFEGTLPTGKGLLTFRNTDEALAGIEAINSDYAGHARAARQIAEEYFDSSKVLGRLLNLAGLEPPKLSAAVTVPGAIR